MQVTLAIDDETINKLMNHMQQAGYGGTPNDLIMDLVDISIYELLSKNDVNLSPCMSVYSSNIQYYK